MVLVSRSSSDDIWSTYVITAILIHDKLAKSQIRLLW